MRRGNTGEREGSPQINSPQSYLKNQTHSRAASGCVPFSPPKESPPFAAVSPKMERRTPLLSCSKSHKKRTGCTGKKRISEVSVAQFDDNLVLSDYNLLMEAERRAESSRRMRESICGLWMRRPPYKMHGSARYRKFHFAVLPGGMSRGLKNKNFYCQRGIDVVRNMIKMFAQQKVTLPPGRHKIIILDEADSMTSGAQQALRRTMEIYSNTTRFALACNTSSKIIEPIQSRCALVRFSRLSDQEILGRLMIVVEAEKVPYVPEGLEAIIFTADGDMRQALNNLQATFSGFRFVSQENVFKVCDQPHPLHVKSMVGNILDGKFDDACAGLKQLYDLGYSPTDIITTLFRIIKNYDMAEFLKLEFLKETGFAHMRICDGVGSLLQLSGLLAKFALAREAAKAP